ncbi:MAG TPA: hypothetical protein VMS22_15625 [Candidatus Eisenbacteria bacterium]|nr:hypothetical protein [Candidatus Eisenbacteria bacterium]
MRFSAFVLAILLACPGPAPAKQPRPPVCTPGRFVVQGGQLLASIADSASLTIGDGTAAIGAGCPFGVSRIARPKRTSTLTAFWKICTGIARVRVKARFDAACDTLTGAVTGKKQKRQKFTATRSRCGDGIVDAGAGEACDGATGCTAPLHCSAACACVGDPGSRDTSFGSSGVATVGNAGMPFLAFGLGVQPSGSIIVAGGFNTLMADGGIGVARFTADGQLDPTFGAGGWTLTKPIPAIDFMSDMKVLPDGRILVAGRTGFGDNRVIVRYDADGHPDPLFGVGGTATFDSDSCYEVEPLLSVAPSGAVYAAFPDVGCTNPDFKARFVRLTESGAVDPGFDLKFNYPVTFSVVRPDERVAIATVVHPPDSVQLFEPTGLPVLSFGTGGMVFPSFGTSSAGGARLFADAGSRLVAITGAPTPAGAGFALERWTADGGDDQSFGSMGRVVTVGSSDEYALGLSFDATGRLVVVGSGPAALLVRRYADDGTLDTTFGVGTVAVPGMQGVDVAVLPDGKIIVLGRQMPAMGDPYRYGVLMRLWP